MSMVLKDKIKISDSEKIFGSVMNEYGTKR